MENDADIYQSEDGERKAQMLEETRQALADINAGRIVGGEEVMDWLESWGTDQEKAPPTL